MGIPNWVSAVCRRPFNRIAYLLVPMRTTLPKVSLTHGKKTNCSQYLKLEGDNVFYALSETFQNMLRDSTDGRVLNYRRAEQMRDGTAATSGAHQSNGVGTTYPSQMDRVQSKQTRNLVGVDP